MSEKKPAPTPTTEAKTGPTDKGHFKTADPVTGWHNLGKEAAKREKAANAARKWGKRNG